MAFDESLTERIRNNLPRKKNVEEKKMFDAIGFMLNRNVLMDVRNNSLIVRFDH